MSAEEPGSRDGGGSVIDLPILWRVSRAGLTTARACVAVSSVAIVTVTAWVLLWPDADMTAAGLVAASCAVIAVAFWRAAIHPSVEANKHGLVVRNPMETQRISWDEVVDATAGFDGVTVRLRSGRATTIWAVQKSSLSTWRRKRTRADEVASTIRRLAAAHAATSAEAPASAAHAPVRRDVEPVDAFRSPLRFPWRMSRAEAAVIGFLRHSYSPVVSAAAAALYGVLGVVVLGLEVGAQWDAHVLHERGVVVHATVVDVPGQVKVVWPAIAPTAIYLDRGRHPVSDYPIGSNVDVVSDPQRPTRAAIVGVTPDGGSTAQGLVMGIASLLMASGYAKWARWLAVTAANNPPEHPGRHQAGRRH